MVAFLACLALGSNLSGHAPTGSGRPLRGHFAILLGSSTSGPGTAVLVHGAGGGGWEYDRWRPALEAAGWRVVARNLAPSPRGLARTRFADYASQVVLWGKGARRPFVLVGASMGGPLVLRAAERLHPDALVLVNPVPPAGLRTGARPKALRRKSYPAVVRWANGPLKDTRDAMPDSEESTILWAWKKWRDESGRVLSELSRGVKVAKPRCPVLVVIGEADKDVPPAGSRTLAQALNADVCSFSGMSHVGPLLAVRAPEVAHKVLQWLTQVLDPVQRRPPRGGERNNWRPPSSHRTPRPARSAP